MSKLWDREEDQELWNCRSKPTGILADRFGRSNGGIRSRLKHLQNPEHKAYKRLFGTCSSAPTQLSQSSSAELEAIRHEEREVDALVRAITNRQSITTPTVSNFPPAPPPAASMNTRSPQNNISLNPEQESACQLILTGINVFLTGAAGVGKSFLLQHAIAQLQSRCSSDVAVTASTGIAATHISGTTLHSWAGIGLGRGDVGKLIRKVLESSQACHRWRTTRTLVIDEISMIDGKLFEALNSIGQAVRGNPRPFGGLQLVLCGDFYQLPPISLVYAGFSFSAAAWKHGNIAVVELTTVVRQEGDLDFINALRQLREGRCSSEVEALLATCHVSKKQPSMDGILPTKLYCTNKNVDAENNTKLNELNGLSQQYDSREGFKGNYSYNIIQSLRQLMDKKTPPVLRLKIGAQVMLIKNTPEWNLVNGSRGIVVGFAADKKRYPIIQFTSGDVHTVTPFEVFQAISGGAMTREQLPIKLAWCWTVHKSQGMTLDRLELQLDDAFDYGQVYVALSRVKSLEGLWIKGKAITQNMVKAHPDVLEFHRKEHT